MLVEMKLPKITRHKHARAIVKQFTKNEGPEAADPDGWAGVTDDQLINSLRKWC